MATRAGDSSERSRSDCCKALGGINLRSLPEALITSPYLLESKDLSRSPPIVMGGSDGLGHSCQCPLAARSRTDRNVSYGRFERRTILVKNLDTVTLIWHECAKL